MGLQSQRKNEPKAFTTMIVDNDHAPSFYNSRLSKDAIPALAPASVSSCGESQSSYDCGRDQDALTTTRPLPKEIDASRPKKISFGEVSLRSYPVILGDHPDTSSGPPVSFAEVAVKAST